MRNRRMPPDLPQVRQIETQAAVVDWYDPRRGYGFAYAPELQGGILINGSTHDASDPTIWPIVDRAPVVLGNLEFVPYKGWRAGRVVSQDISWLPCTMAAVYPDPGFGFVNVRHKSAMLSARFNYDVWRKYMDGHNVEQYFGGLEASVYDVDGRLRVAAFRRVYADTDTA